MHLAADLGERAVAAVAVQARLLSAVREPQVVRRDVPGRRHVSRDEQVEPAVVVVVEEPRRKRLARLAHAGALGDVGEPHDPRRVLAVVVEQPVRAVERQVGDVQVRATVVVVVAPHGALDEADDGDPGLAGDVRERAVPVVVPQLARVRRLADRRFVSHEQVDPPVVVVVGPGAGLRRMERQEPGLLGDIVERPVAAVAQERVGEPALLAEPRAAQDEHVEVAVVVVVRMHRVEPADDAGKAGRSAPILERPVPAVAQDVERIADAPRRQEQVEIRVAIEIVENRRTRKSRHVDARARRDVDEPLDVVLGLERGGRNEPRRFDLLRILAERHVGDVQEPARGQIERLLGEDPLELRDRGARASGLGMHPRAADREQARIGAVVPDAVLLLAEPQIAHRELLAQARTGTSGAARPALDRARSTSAAGAATPRPSDRRTASRSPARARSATGPRAPWEPGPSAAAPGARRSRTASGWPRSSRRSRRAGRPSGASPRNAARPGAGRSRQGSPQRRGSPRTGPPSRRGLVPPACLPPRFRHRAGANSVPPARSSRAHETGESGLDRVAGGS